MTGGVGSCKRTFRGPGQDRQEFGDCRRIVLACAGERVGPADQLLPRLVTIPLLHLSQGPLRVARLVAEIAGIRNPVTDSVLRHRNAHGVTATLSLDTEDGPRHVAIDTRTAGAVGSVVRVG